MTVAAQSASQQLVAAAGQLVFPFAWRCDSSDLVTVWVNDVLDGGFTVARNADQTAAPGGTVTRDVMCLGGEVVTIERSTPQTQNTAFTRYGPFAADTVTAALDKLVMLLQELAVKAGRALTFRRSSSLLISSTELPTPADGALLLLLSDPLNAGKFVLDSLVLPAPQEGAALVYTATAGASRFALGTALAATRQYLETYVQQVLSGGGVVQPVSWTLIGDDVSTGFDIAGAVLSSPDLYYVTIQGVPQEPTVDYTIDVTVTPPRINFAAVVPFGSRAVVRTLGYAKGVTGGTKLYPTTPALLAQTNAAIYGGAGAPVNANGANGDFYFRSDPAGALTTIYQRRAGAWVGIV